MTETDAEAQVVDATEQGTPRKKRSSLWRISLIGTAVFLVFMIAIIAYGIAFPIEGKLYCWGDSGLSGMGMISSLRQGVFVRSQGVGMLASLHRAFASRAIRFDVMPDSDAVPSPDGSEWAWSINTGGGPWTHERELAVGSIGGSARLSLSGASSLGGVNCYPRWSPDGKMIAFRHVDAAQVKRGIPCRVGFQLWVINADGTNPRHIKLAGIPDSTLANWFSPEFDWAPDGSRLLLYADRIGKNGYAFTTDLTGSDVEVLPNVGFDPDYSPDGNLIASSAIVKGQSNGQPGVWRQLLVTRADGTEPTVLAEQFLSDDEIVNNFPTAEQTQYDPKFDWEMDVRIWAGPRKPQWSPSGDMIAFLAGMPFEPVSISSRDQVDVWLLDLNDNRLINLTDDNVYQHDLLWCK